VLQEVRRGFKARSYSYDEFKVASVRSNLNMAMFFL
jgi:hypothetical protein